jgi:RNA polymerase sigma factor (sigma-70 family)
MEEDLQLLREYAEQRSERAFTELVHGHIDFVYSTALRIVNEPQLVEDVTQLVFIKLAEKAASLRTGTILTGWLYRTTQFTAETALRSEWRRRKREKLAMEIIETHDSSDSVWKDVAPLLEAAITRLRQADQDAVLLRFFAGKSLREVGQALGISDDAAQKRVDRALEKMRAYLAKQGVAVSASTLAPAIAAHAVQTAPVGLASTLIPASLAGSIGTTIGTTTFGALKTMALANIKSTAAGLIASAILLITGTLLVVHSLNKPQEANAAAPPSPESKPDFVVRGTVRSPDGKPLAGAFLRLATVGGFVRLYDTNAFPTNIRARVSYIATNTAADGTFVIRLSNVPPQGKAVVVVNDEAGYAVATAADLSSNPEITVEPWGRIEGVLRIGKSLGTNQTVSLSIWGTSETYEWNIVSHSASAKTDANGRFVFSRVAPGDIWLTRSVTIRPGEARQSGHHYVKVAPGQHVNVEFGGIGRSVMGRIQWDSTEKLAFYGTLWAKESHNMRNPPNWRDMTSEERRRYIRQWRDTPQAERFKDEVRNYEFPVKADGTFWVDDVLPGRYRMQVRADANLPNGQPPRLAAKAEIHVDVPETSGNNSEPPLDLGTLYPQPQ